MHEVKNPQGILEQGRKKLAQGDIDGYWKQLGQYSPYAKFAGKIARGGTDPVLDAMRRVDRGDILAA